MGESTNGFQAIESGRVAGAFFRVCALTFGGIH